MNFRIKEKLVLWISGSKKNLFQRRNPVGKYWPPVRPEDAPFQRP